MENNITYTAFFKAVHESISNGTFSKLTLAKTIGKPELQNIYIRLIVEDDKLKCTFTKKIYDGEKHEITSIHEIENLESELTPYFTAPFFTGLLFTTEADITLKINKKKAVSIIEQAPTFKNVDPVLLEFLRK
jgi:hypothetical protein